MHFIRSWCCRKAFKELVHQKLLFARIYDRYAHSRYVCTQSRYVCTHSRYVWVSWSWRVARSLELFFQLRSHNDLWPDWHCCCAWRQHRTVARGSRHGDAWRHKESVVGGDERVKSITWLWRFGRATLLSRLSGLVTWQTESQISLHFYCLAINVCTYVHARHFVRFGILLVVFINTTLHYLIL